MKSKILMTVATLLAATSLASCTGCAGNTKISFKPYFLKDVDAPVSSVYEKLTYDVVHEGNASYNGYTVNYTNGVNELTLTRTTEEDGTEVYTLQRSFSINVTFTYGGVSTEVLTDSIESTVEFLSAKNTLRPISSYKRTVSHSPMQADVTKPDDCYKKYDQTVTIEYGENSGTAVITNNLQTSDNVKTREFEIDTEDYTYVDNEQLLFALRCMNPNSAAKLQAYAPFSGVTQIISTTFGSEATASDFENLVIDGVTEAKREISYYKVDLKINADNSGATQTVWIAKTTDTKNNAFRNVMLRHEAPLPFGMGKIVYSLKEADFN